MFGFFQIFFLNIDKKNFVWSNSFILVIITCFLGDVIIGKWQNIRDAFIRSLKKKSGQGYTKNYIYSEQLKFLLKIAQKDDTESSIIEEELTEDINVEDNVSEEVISYRSPLAKKNKQKEERRNKRHAEDDLDREIIKALKTCDTPKTPPDEDQSFFNLFYHLCKL